MYAYHSLGRASVFKVIETHDEDTLKKELESAVAFFEKSSKESENGPGIAGGLPASSLKGKEM
jgi:hypothetical protein